MALVDALFIVACVWGLGFIYALLHDGDSFTVAVFWWAQSFDKILAWVQKTDPALTATVTKIETKFDAWVTANESKVNALQSQYSGLSQDVQNLQALVKTLVPPPKTT